MSTGFRLSAWIRWDFPKTFRKRTRLEAGREQGEEGVAVDSGSKAMPAVRKGAGEIGQAVRRTNREFITCDGRPSHTEGHVKPATRRIKKRPPTDGAALDSDQRSISLA